MIDGMALQPAGVQPNIISLPWVNFSLPRSEHQSLVIACAHWICTTRTRAMISCRSTSHSRRLTRRRLRSLSSFNQANLHRLVRIDGIKTCVVRALRLIPIDYFFDVVLRIPRQLILTYFVSTILN